MVPPAAAVAPPLRCFQERQECGHTLGEMEGEGFKKGLPGKQANGEGLRVGIVHARWNTPIVSR